MSPHRRSDAPRILVLAAGIAIAASTRCSKQQAPDTARSAPPPADPAAPEATATEAPAAPATPAAAPAPAPPRELASATRDNPLRPQATPGPSIRNDAGRPVAGPPRLETLKL